MPPLQDPPNPIGPVRVKKEKARSEHDKALADLFVANTIGGFG
jgi:hypothetical protein